ncbi:hypothetical protein Tco_0085309 [Tanacetum coccineum]
MVNVIPPDHVDDLHVVEPNQHDDVPAIPEHVLVDEDKDPKEEEFKKEEEPQEEDDDMEIDIKENDKFLCRQLRTWLKPEDETVPASVHEVGTSILFFGRMTSLSRLLCGRETTHALVEKKGKAKDEYYGKLILDLGNEVRSSMEEGMAVMENLVRKLSNAEEKAECKKLKKELEEARGSVFEERPNEAIDLLIKNEKSPSSKSRESPHDSYVDAAIAAERARHTNAGNDAREIRVSGVRFWIKMENEHELSYETLTRVYLGSYEHYKSVEAEVEYLEPGFELQGAKMVEMGHDPRIIKSRERLLTWVIEGEGVVQASMGCVEARKSDVEV